MEMEKKNHLLEVKILQLEREAAERKDRENSQLRMAQMLEKTLERVNQLEAKQAEASKMMEVDSQKNSKPAETQPVVHSQPVRVQKGKSEPVQQDDDGDGDDSLSDNSDDEEYITTPNGDRVPLT